MGSSLHFKDVVTAGTWCLDVNRLITAWPAEDHSAKILETSISGGGSACNFAIDILALCPEVEVATIALAGDDEYGRLLKDLAQQHGIDVERFRLLRGESTHFTDAYTSAASGRRTHIYSKGCADLLDVEHFDFNGLEGRFLHLGLSGAHARLDAANAEDPTGWVSVLKRAKKAGLITNIETQSAEDPRQLAKTNLPSLPYLDLLIVNDWEIQALAGRTGEEITTNQGDMVDAARKILNSGSMELVVVHEPRFAICIPRAGEPIIVPSIRVPRQDIVGANGAGDAFAAGFVCGIRRQRPVEECLFYGHAAAVASMSDITPYKGVRSIEECLSSVRALQSD